MGTSNPFSPTQSKPPSPLVMCAVARHTVCATLGLRVDDNTATGTTRWSEDAIEHGTPHEEILHHQVRSK